MSNSFATPWSVVGQGPLFMGYPRQEYKSGLPCPFPGDLPNPGIQPASFDEVFRQKSLDNFYLYVYDYLYIV